MGVNACVMLSRCSSTLPSPCLGCSWAKESILEQKITSHVVKLPRGQQNHRRCQQGNRTSANAGQGDLLLRKHRSGLSAVNSAGRAQHSPISVKKAAKHNHIIEKLGKWFLFNQINQSLERFAVISLIALTLDDCKWG